MHKTKYRKTTRPRPPGVKSDPREGKSKFQKNDYHQQHKTTMLTSRDKVAKVGVIVRYIKKVIEKNQGWGHI
jgi:hypothetical protein